MPFKFKLFIAFAEVISTAITLTTAQPVELDRTLLGALQCCCRRCVLSSRLSASEPPWITLRDAHERKTQRCRCAWIEQSRQDYDPKRRLYHFGVHPRVPVLRYVPTTGAATCQCAYQKRCSHSVHFASKQIQAVSCTNNLSLFSDFGTADASASPGRPLGRFSRPAAQSRWPSLKSATRAPSQTLRSGQVRSGQVRSGQTCLPLSSHSAKMQGHEGPDPSL